MSQLAHTSAPAVAEVEVSAKRTRRRFSAADKKAVLDEADACTKSGELEALLRRKGIYSSSLYAWRRARERGELDGLAPKRRRPLAKVPSAAQKEVIELKRALAKTEARLKRSQASVELQNQSRSPIFASSLLPGWDHPSGE